MIKTLLTGIFSFTVFVCSAQKQLLTYQDLQYIIQNKPALVTAFLKEKDYRLQPGFNNNEIRFSGFYADADYTDIVINTNNRRTTVNLSTTHLPQVEMIQKAIGAYPSRNSKGAKIYRVKDASVSTVSLKEDEPQGHENKLYTVELEN